MARHVLTLRTEADRAKVMGWLKNAAYGHRVEVKEPKRTDEQNDRFWELLGRVAKKMTLAGREFSPDEWKCVFMKAMGRESHFLPTLDGAGFFPSGFRSSDLSVREMCDLQVFIEAWCAEKGVDIWGQEAKG